MSTYEQTDTFSVAREMQPFFWAEHSIADRLGDTFTTAEGEMVFEAMDFAVYMLLCHYADASGQCFPSLSTIQKRLGISRPSVTKRLQRLEEMGFISKARRTDEKRGHASSLYTIRRNEPAPSKMDLLASKTDLPPLVKPVYYPSKTVLPEQEPNNKNQSNDPLPASQGGGEASPELQMTITNAEVPRYKPYEQDHAAWYKAYPRRVKPDDSLKAYQKRRRQGMTAEGLLRAAGHAAQCFASREKDHIPYPATFLNSSELPQWIDGIPDGYRSSRSGVVTSPDAAPAKAPPAPLVFKNGTTLTAPTLARRREAWLEDEIISGYEHPTPDDLAERERRRAQKAGAR